MEVDQFDDSGDLWNSKRNPFACMCVALSKCDSEGRLADEQERAFVKRTVCAMPGILVNCMNSPSI